MAIGNFVAYYRVSTDKQGKSGLGLEAQRVAVEDFLNGGNWELVEEFTEVESGSRKDRPELERAMAACRKHKATLVIAKLDRLARNVAFVANLMESGVEFVAVDMPQANKLTVHILAAVAEHEREMISQRTRDALAAAKARGVKLGNPNIAMARAKGQLVIKSKADKHAQNILPVITAIRDAGVTSLRSIADALNQRGIETARGGSWHAASVGRIIQRTQQYRA
jgi:DNA invertase Pin-like site-specific DNA recombinase